MSRRELRAGRVPVCMRAVAMRADHFAFWVCMPLGTQDQSKPRGFVGSMREEGGIKNPKGAANEVRRSYQRRMAWGSSDVSFGKYFMKDFWSGVDSTMVLSGRTQW
jgi:hypothetical protein